MNKHNYEEDIKSQAQGIEPSVKPRNVNELSERSTNVYESLAIISNRAKQISSQLKRELQGKLEEFSIVSETLEEVNENKEQIEISKFYERLPNPVTIAAHEFMEGKLAYRYRRDEEQNTED